MRPIISKRTSWAILHSRCVNLQGRRVLTGYGSTSPRFRSPACSRLKTSSVSLSAWSRGVKARQCGVDRGVALSDACPSNRQLREPP